MVDWIVGVVSIYLLWQQNQIFRQQNRIFDRQEGTNVVSSERAVRIAAMRRYWPMVAMAVMVLLTWAAVGYDVYERHQHGAGAVVMSPAEWSGYKFEEVSDHHFTHETVVLDGKRFKDCAFDQVTLVYDASLPFAFAGTSHISEPTLRTTNARILNYLILLKQLGFVAPDVHTGMTGGQIMMAVPNSDLGAQH